MTITIVAIPLDPTCNSYVSSEDMMTYVNDRVADQTVVDAWTALSDDDKAMYLVNSARSLDSFADWNGLKYSRDQQLKWPRTDVWIEEFWVDNTTFPIPVIQAACELALFMMTNDGATSVSSGGVFDSIGVGPLRIDFNNGSPVNATGTKFYPDILPILLKDYGSLEPPDVPGSNRLKQVRLTRA